jgi:tetratricopeptide (TPR) repeat protein
MNPCTNEKTNAPQSDASTPQAGEMPGMARPPVPQAAGRPAGLNDHWTVFGVCIFLTVATWLVFGQTVHHEFVNFDDKAYVYENPVIQNGVTVEGLRWALTYGEIGHWHPLTWFSHMLDCQFYGLNAGGHHLTNVLLHTVTALLLFLVLQSMTGFLWRSAFVAAVFAIHPLRVESVAWVAERKDVLSGLFFMLTIGAYVRYVRHPPSMIRYGVVMTFFTLGLLAKNMLVTTPFVLLLLDYWPLGRLSDPSPQIVFRRVAEKVPLLLLTILSCVATAFVPEKVTAADRLSFALRMENALASYVTYLWQMIHPAGLTCLYLNPADHLALWQTTGSLGLVLAISGSVYAFRKTHPYLAVGWLWYLGMMIPVIGIVQISYYAHADRYTYLPQIGLYLALTWMGAELCAAWRHRRLLLGGFSTLVLVALFFCARVQTSYWRNSESLWTHALDCAPDNTVAQNNLGDFLARKGKVDEAISLFKHALQIKPDYAEAHYNLANALIQKGNVDEAIVHYQEALRIKPKYVEAHNNLANTFIQMGRVDEAITQFQLALQLLKPDRAEAHMNLANALIQKGNVDEAITQLQKALQIEPDHVLVRNTLGYALLQQGKVDEAISQFQMVLQFKPDYANAHFNLANALIQKGRVDEAITRFQRVLEIKPGFAEAHYDLANALIQNGRVDEAITHFQLALQIKPDYPEAQNDLAWELATAAQASLRNGNKAVELAQRANQLAGGSDLDIVGTLAAAYAEAGRFDDAIRSARKAIDLARATGQWNQVEQLNGELKLYEAGFPYHQENK